MAKYWAVFRISFVHALLNGKALVGLSIFIITCMIIFSHLWKIAAAKLGASSLNADQLLWYIAFNEWVIVSIPDVQDDMEEDFRSGRLAYLLPRPISYLGATYAEAVGCLFANLLVLGTVTFAFTWQQTVHMPFSLEYFPLLLLFGVAAGLIGTIFHMIIGLTAFWLHEITPFFWIWEKLLFMFGGLMLPLTVYPVWMQTIAHYTPFPLLLGGRSALVLDWQSAIAWQLAGLMIFWGILACVCLFWIYRRGLRILNIEGG